MFEVVSVLYGLPLRCRERHLAHTYGTRDDPDNMSRGELVCGLNRQEREERKRVVV